MVGCSVRCLTVKTSAPLHPRRAHPAELLPRRRQTRPSTLGVLPHREGDAVDPLTSSPNSLSPFLAGSRGPWAGGGAGGGRPGLRGRVGPVLVEMCILLSKGAFRPRDVQLEVPVRVRSARLGARGRCGSARGPTIAAAAVRAGVRGRRFVQICCKDPDRAEAPEEDHQYSALSSAAYPGPVRVVAGDSDIPAHITLCRRLSESSRACRSPLFRGPSGS